MSEIIVSSSSNSDKREIDEYHDSGSSGSSTSISSIGGNWSSPRGPLRKDEDEDEDGLWVLCWYVHQCPFVCLFK